MRNYQVLFKHYNHEGDGRGSRLAISCKKKQQQKIWVKITAQEYHVIYRHIQVISLISFVTIHFFD